MGSQALSSEVEPLSVVYSEILWLSAIVLVLAVGALVGLFSRKDSSEYESVKPLLLSAEQRALLLQDNNSTIIKAFEARKTVKKSIKASRRELAKNRHETTAADLTK